MQDDKSSPDAASSGDWWATLRHDLRTPLNQIIGYAGMLGDMAEDLEEPAFVDDLGKIERAGWKLLGQIDTLTEALRNAQVRPDRPELQGEHAPTGETLPAEVEPSAGRSPSPPPLDASLMLPGALLDLSGEQDARTRAFNPTVGSPTHRRLRAKRDQETQPGRSPRLLVVDDNPQNLEMLARRLMGLGYEVCLAHDGREALSLVEGQVFDLVLLDVLMPEVSGTEVLATLREHYDPTTLPIIMATALDASADVVLALKLGANDYVTKPLDFDVVMARVQTQLALKQARDHIHTLNRRLDNAHDQLASLSDSHDIASWATPIGEDLCQMVGASEATLWLIEDGALAPATETDTPPPAWSDISTLPHTQGFKLADRTGLFSVASANGTQHGVLVVRGERVRWREHEIALVSRYARQFGGALELQQMRRKLAEAALRRQATRDDLIRRGVELVHVCPDCGHCNDLEAETCRLDGKSLAKARVLPALVSGRYRFGKLLGEGGMGTVYQAQDERLSRDVAIKVMRSEHFGKEEARVRFASEATTIAQIEHPNVISVFDAGNLEDGSLFMVAEMLYGMELSRILRRDGTGTPKQVAHLLRQAASALGAAHHAALVHRDVKPANIFVLPGRGEFTVKVIDFGVAKRMDCDTELTNTGQIVGTPVYMSPEQLCHKQVDARSDLYSLAATAYEALVGRRVTLATDIFAVVVDVVRGTPPPVSSLLKRVPREVDRGFRTGLAKTAEERPASIEAWANELAYHIARIPQRTPGWDV